MKSKKSPFLICLMIVFLITSCATTSKISPDMSENAKNLQPPAGRSLVYVYRTSALGFAVGLNVSLNGKLLASFYPKRFYLCTLDPGKYIFTGNGENEDDLILTTEPNKKYYIEAKPRMGFASARIELELHDQIDGNAGVQKCRMVGSTASIAPNTSQNVTPVKTSAKVAPQNESQIPKEQTAEPQTQKEMTPVQSYSSDQSMNPRLSFGQTKQGNFVVSGATGIQFINSNSKSIYDGKTNYSYKTNSFSISPSFAYFVTDNLAIGLSGSFNSYSEKEEGNNYDYSSTSSLIMPMLLYYIPMEDNVRPFLQVGAGISSSSDKYNESGGYSDKSSSSGTAFNIGAGLAYFVSENISLNFGVSYTKSKTTDGDNKKSETQDGNFGGNVGLSIYF